MEPIKHFTPQGLNEAPSSPDTPWVLGRGIFWLEHLAVRRRVGVKVTGDPKKLPPELLRSFLLTNGYRLPLERGLTLGCGTGNIERGFASMGLVRCHDAIDISEKAIARARELAEQAGLHSICYTIGDANEVKLPADTYDIVIGQYSFHHFARLEHVFTEVANTLKKDGILYLNEFIGPTRFQWTDRQLEATNAILKALPKKYRVTESGTKGLVSRPTIRSMIQRDPSEAVRSAEIIPVMLQYFDVLERRDYGGTILHLLLSGIARNFTSVNKHDEELLDIVFRLEDALIECGDLSSDFTVIIAKKKEKLGNSVRICQGQRPEAPQDQEPQSTISAGDPLPPSVEDPADVKLLTEQLKDVRRALSAQTSETERLRKLLVQNEFSIGRLKYNLSAIQQTFSWKVTRPIRGVRKGVTWTWRHFRQGPKHWARGILRRLERPLPQLRDLGHGISSPIRDSRSTSGPPAVSSTRQDQLVNTGSTETSLSARAESTRSRPMEAAPLFDNTGKLGKRPYENFDQYLCHALVSPEIESPFLKEDRLIITMMNWHLRQLIGRFASRDQDTRVSIVLPIGRRTGDLGAVIDSIIAQSYKNWELLVTDATKSHQVAALCRSFSDNRVRYLEVAVEGNEAAAMNAGLKQAKGEYLAYGNVDHIWNENFLLITMNSLRDLGVEAVYCAKEVLRRSAESDGHELAHIEKLCFGPYNRGLLENHDVVDLVTFVHHRKLFEQHGMFSTDLPADISRWEYVGRIASTTVPFALTCVLVRHYQWPDKSENETDAPSVPTLGGADLRPLLPEIGCANEGVSFFAPAGPLRQASRSPKVSIVIPNYEALEFLKLCIASIRRFTNEGSYEIVIVDNASGSATRDYLLKLREEGDIRVILSEKNLGFTYAANRGIEESDSDSDVFLVNNDALVTPGWLPALLEVLDLVDDVGLIFPRQTLLPHAPTMKTHVPLCREDREIDVNLSAHHRNVIDPYFDIRRGLIELAWAPFFAVYIPRSTLREVGCLDDESGLHYGSDKQYCELVRYFGRKRLVYTPHSKLYHFLQQATHDLKKADKGLYHQLYIANERLIRT